MQIPYSDHTNKDSMTGQEKARDIVKIEREPEIGLLQVFIATLSPLNFTLSKIGNISVLLTN